MTTFPMTLSETTLTVLIGTKPYQVSRSHPHWEELVEALNDPASTADRIIELAKPVEFIRNALADSNYISIVNDQLFYGDEPVHSALGLKIIDLLREGFDVEPWVRFAENVYANPFREAREELYTFLERAKIPITPDGCFVPFKKVRADYTDCHTGTFDNSVGQVHEMPRELVDNNRHNHCSNGFHFCSESYLKSFGYQGGRDHVMLLKVNPKDVVSIPTDYNFAKGRTCRYEVIGEIEEAAIPHMKFDAVYTDHIAPVSGKITVIADGEELADSKTNKKKGKKLTKTKDKAKATTKATKKNKKAIAIETEHYGRMTYKQFRNNVKDYGSMAAWGRAEGIPSSTIRTWGIVLEGLRRDRNS